MTQSAARNRRGREIDDGLVILFDGHAMFHRAFHAIQHLSVSHSGEATNAVFGVSASLLKVLGERRPAYAAVAFDVSGPTFRHEMYEGYKAQRPHMPDEMRAQYGRVREAVETIGLSIVELPGYEADDVLGHFSRRATERGLRTIIVTGDQDTMQLVSPTVSILYQRGARNESLFDPDAVKERYGLAPAQIPDLKALQGDPSDNIPGVQGVGSKTATTLLSEYGTVGELYEHIDDVTPERIRQRLVDGREAAMQGLELTRIVTDLDLPVTLDDLQWTENFDRSRLVAFFREMEFTSLLNRIPDISDESAESVEAVPTVADVDATYRSVSTMQELEDLITEISDATHVSIVVPVTSHRVMEGVPVGVGISWASGQAAYIPLMQEGLGIPIATGAGILHRLGRFLAENGPEETPRTLVTHVAREILPPLENGGVEITNPIWDTSVAAHMLGKPSTALSILVLSEFGQELPTREELLGRGAKAVPFHALDEETALHYTCSAADYTLRMMEAWAPILKEQGAEPLFEGLEMPLAPVLSRMERNGVRLDTGLLGTMSGEMHGHLDQMTQEIYDEAGAGAGMDEPLVFNLNSPKQLGEVLFEKLGLPARRRTQTGYSTDAAVLEGLVKSGEQHSHIVQRILEYRELSKLVSTYVDSLPKDVYTGTGRIHTSFNQTGSATGRIASQDPNLQNIPVRTESGRRIREAFIASDGAQLVSADYSQVELRVLAHLSDDAGLKDAFHAGEDIHSSTASTVMGLDPEDVTSEHRRIAKAVNFGIVYGMGGFGLATRLEIERKEADAFIEAYFERFPMVRAYMDRTIEGARENGYVQTLLGRRRYLPEITASNQQVRAAAERMAINMPVQGTAAEIIKLAMLRMQERLDETEMRTQMLLQIHDELLFEAPDDEQDALAAIVDEVMPVVMPELDVPLVVDVKSGPSWGQMS